MSVCPSVRLSVPISDLYLCVLASVDVSRMGRTENRNRNRNRQGYNVVRENRKR